jgi:hypothetical protein
MTRTISKGTRTYFLILSASIALLALESTTHAQENDSAKARELYTKIKAFSLSGGSSETTGLVLKRDRVEVTFDGTFYFMSPIEGRIVGAVFIGQGKFRAEVPSSEFEKDNVRRMLGTDFVESDFKSAVFKVSDDSFDQVAANRREGGAIPERAQRLATELDGSFLKESGANLSARLTMSMLNAEKPGFFFGSFDGGRRGRFSLILDYQNRIPVANFSLNAGEKGLIISYQGPLYGNDVWMAFYSLEDYQNRRVQYSDRNDLIDIISYQMNLDLLDPGSRLSLDVRLVAEVRHSNLIVLPLQIGESLGEYDNMRLKKQLRLKSVRSAGAELSAVQEAWEGGLTVFLAKPAQVGEKLDLSFEFAGDFMRDPGDGSDCFYPVSNTSWYPRHGYIDRATAELTFLHKKRRRIASVGARVSEEPNPEDKDSLITKYKMEHPVSFMTFALGPFERHRQMVKWDRGGEPIPVEFNSLPGSSRAIKEDFIVAELDNSLRYFSVLFGKYPYPIFSAAFHPYGFGQGFPSLLMIPPTDRASKRTYSFVAHETAHQWWGNIVAWRSYRDQWLSEGFAEYSGILYTGLRDGANSRDDLLRELKRSLNEPPRTDVGIGKGRLVDVGPIILGHRLNTSKTYGAYQALIYNKGALVLRMLHFLMSSPVTGDDTAFTSMMTDFVERHRNKSASTDDFSVVASEHFAKTPIGQKYGLKDLNWFFNQWVHQTGLPSYHLEYQMQDQPDGSCMVTGTVAQENVPGDWFMPLPLVFTFSGKQTARGTIHALGPRTPFQLKLPMKPSKVELDPNDWILSAKTTAKGK